MKRALASLMMVAGALGAGALAGCGGDNGTPNPPQLFLALNGDELHARLVDQSPPPF